MMPFFFMQDISLYIDARCLNTMLASHAELEASTYVTYTFTTQNNGKRGDNIIHICSGNALCCVRATIRRLKYVRLHGAKSTAPIASYYHGSRCIVVKARDVTDTMQSDMTAKVHQIDVHANEIRTRSLRAGGAMALLCGKVDFNLI
jgi:hypothetical protein